MKKPETFETSLERLEAIVNTLEDGEMPLEQSLKAYEEAVGLVRYCTKTLETAKQKVRLLTELPDGTATERPLDIDDET